MTVRFTRAYPTLHIGDLSETVDATVAMEDHHPRGFANVHMEAIEGQPNLLLKMLAVALTTNRDEHIRSLLGDLIEQGKFFIDFGKKEKLNIVRILFIGAQNPKHPKFDLWVVSSELIADAGKPDDTGE